MAKEWNSIEEAKFLNKAYAIFDRYRIAVELLHPDFAEYYTIRKENVYDIINEMLLLIQSDHPLWNFPQFPDEHGSAGQVTKK